MPMRLDKCLHNFSICADQFRNSSIITPRYVVVWHLFSGMFSIWTESPIKNNTILRILQNKNRETHNLDLYKTYNTMPVDLLHESSILLFMRCCVLSPSTLPEALRNLFIRNVDVHSHNTRQKYDFNVQHNVSKNSIFHIGPSLWYKLPLIIRNCPTYTNYKKNVKTILHVQIRNICNIWLYE